MSKIAIIPARGGSKRIPRKNIRDFLGKPILAYAIEAAQKSGLFDKVIVSTDDVEIAQIARQFGAETPFVRSAQNSNDTATTADVLLEVLDFYKQQNIPFDQGVCIYPCAPFVKADLLTEASEVLQKHKADVVFPVIRYGHPIQRALKLDENGKISAFFDGYAQSRTQDLEVAFHDAGMFYFFEVARFEQTKSLRTENTIAIEIDENNAQDIDSESDWQLAELKYQNQK
ncbi:MAG: pseudaminic acid cytidylyltransferase [Bacteroidetes bacterium]|nr:pseudaminic acid cytidylyltransferase [Bacteroidota bacterium]